jgi:hypothetical protein
MKQAKLSFAGRASNPTKASPAQLAARKRFAEMARSGAFKKKATKRKANPLPPVVETILEQMGGNKFMVMTGARPVVHGPHMLTFKLPTNQSKANYLDVIHNPGKDLYTMTFRRVSNRGMDSKNLVEYDDVYADQLQPMFEKVTGMYTTLGTMGRKTNPAKKTVSQKISQLRHEGYPQRQAVAVALSEQRAGKVKRNPMGEIQAYAITRNFKVLGIFQTKQDAIKAAQGISDATGKTLAIKPVQVMAGHFNK